MMGVWLLDKTLNNYDAFLTPFCPWCGAEMINWVKAQLEPATNPANMRQGMRIKVVYDKKGYTKVSSLGIFVEPMSVEQSQIKLWKNDLLERPIVADKEDDPLVAAAKEAQLLNTPVTETPTGADDLPF